MRSPGDIRTPSPGFLGGSVSWNTTDVAACSWEHRPQQSVLVLVPADSIRSFHLGNYCTIIHVYISLVFTEVIITRRCFGRCWPWVERGHPARPEQNLQAYANHDQISPQQYRSMTRGPAEAAYEPYIPLYLGLQPNLFVRTVGNIKFFGSIVSCGCYTVLPSKVAHTRDRSRSTYSCVGYVWYRPYPGTIVLDHACYTISTGQQELDHTDQESICLGGSRARFGDRWCVRDL